jgi:beta-glucosidase
MAAKGVVRVRRRRALIVSIEALVVLLVAVPVSIGVPVSAASPAQPRTQPSCPWVNSTASPQARAEMLVSRMILPQLDEMLYRVSLDPSRTAGIPSLCVPALTLSDGPEGVADGNTGVTQLPAAVSAAATWDPAIVHRFGLVIGSEMAGKGIDVDLGPTVNIVRDPRWGRAFESYGEDPYLSGQIAAADIEGVQSTGTIAMVKHFALYNQETFRNTPADDVIVTDRVAHEIYLPAFQTAIQQGGAGAVMCSYATINGVAACQDPYLANILYGQWSFDGFVQSDDDATLSTVAAANAGLEDLESPNGEYFGPALVQAVKQGEVSIDTVRTMATRVLATMFRFGLFNRTPGIAHSVVTTPAHLAVARSVADAGTVLLKNSDDLLPLTSADSSIAVIGDDGGPHAISSGEGSAHVIASSFVSPLKGITAAAGSGTTVTYSQGNVPDEPGGDPVLEAAAVRAAGSASVAIVFAGLSEREGKDLTGISLSRSVNDLITAVSAANPNTIVVLNTGSAVTMPWLSSVKAVVEAWYPGQQDGNSIADVLFGAVDPSGKLPVTFPVSLADVPASTPAQWPGTNGKVEYSEGLLVGYRWYDARTIAPLFPFGFGLSYTTFSFSNLSVTPTNVTSGGTVTATADLTNTGSVTGADTVQAYVGDPSSDGEPPEQLKGFDKVTLKPGQTARVKIELGPEAFSVWSTADQAWVTNPGSYQVMVGDSSANLPLRAAITVG